MGLTITEKILAKAANAEGVVPGEIISVKLDAVIGHDIGGLAAFRELEKNKITKVFDRNKQEIATLKSHTGSDSSCRATERWAGTCGTFIANTPGGLIAPGFVAHAS